jgi:hypothetical protein
MQKQQTAGNGLTLDQEGRPVLPNGMIGVPLYGWIMPPERMAEYTGTVQHRLENVRRFCTEWGVPPERAEELLGQRRSVWVEAIIAAAGARPKCGLVEIPQPA